jgi:cell wall-associated NlpC family hydrolase
LRQKSPHNFALLPQFFNDGVQISRDELMPGDLVFFETYAPGPSHVGIYAGNRQFIQAGSSGVSYASLESSYFSERFLGAKRVLNTH